MPPITQNGLAVLPAPHPLHPWIRPAALPTPNLCTPRLSPPHCLPPPVLLVQSCHTTCPYPSDSLIRPAMLPAMLSVPPVLLFQASFPCTPGSHQPANHTRLGLIYCPLFLSLLAQIEPATPPILLPHSKIGPMLPSSMGSSKAWGLGRSPQITPLPQGTAMTPRYSEERGQS